MKWILWVVFCLVGFISKAQVSYVPASPYPIEIVQEDGSKLKLYAGGDEKIHYAETEDGYTVIKNKKGIYEFAERDLDGKLIPSGFKAKNLRERKANEINFLTKTQKRLKPHSDGPQQILKSATIQKAFPSSGNRKVLLLLIKYPDLNSSYSAGSFDNLMNQSNYGGNGSVRDYFRENSDNDLNLDIDVFGWYTAAHPFTYYGDKNGDNVARELVGEAVDAAEAAGVNFSIYDNNNDGVVDNLMVVHSGPGAEEGSQTQYVWSHSWSLGYGTYERVYDDTRINGYIIQPETRSYGMVGIGVFCHEFGHALGLPDLYDTDDSSEGLGKWCLMAGGSWLNQERTPAMMSAWCRYDLGWVSPTVIPWPITEAYEGDYSLQPSATSTQCYRIKTQNSNEYFLLENKYKTGFNSYLPGSGLAIFHINSNKYDNDNENLKLVDLEEADGDDDLDHNRNRGDSGDVFPGSSSNSTFNDHTYPNAKTYTSESTGLEISGISLSGSTVNFTIGSQSNPIPNLTYNPSQNSFAVNGTNVEMDLQIQNEGDANAGSFDIAFYLSANTTVTTSDYLIGTHNKSALNAGSEVFAGLSVDVSTIAGIPNGTYYLGYIIDYLEDVGESNENDNSYINTSLQVELNSYPNLTYAGGENMLAINGNTISVELAVLNNGNTASEACRVGYYLSPDMNITTSDYRIDDDFVGILGSGQASGESANINGSYFYGLDEGTYYLGYIIDYHDNVDEEDEDDNTYVFTSRTYTYCPGSLTEINETICAGENFLFQGNYYNQQGEYEFAYINVNGCDSVVVLNLKVIDNDVSFLNEIICEGESYQLGNYLYSESGVYDEVFVNQYGCNSVVILNLEVRERQVVHKFDEICAGNEVQVGPYIYSEGGVYEMAFTDQFGCDSLVILHLTVFPVNDTLIAEAICPGELFEFGGEILNTAGVYTYTFENKFGCDSVVTLDLRINDTKEVFFTENICPGDSVVVGGEAFYNTGIYEMTLTTQWGCDSVIHLDLVVNPTHEIELAETICEGEAIFVGEEEFFETGVYEVTLENSFGCDSVVMLDLTVCPVHDTVIYKEICKNDIYSFEGVDYSEPGVYERILENECGCTYSALIYLEVHQNEETIVETEICEGESYQLGNSFYNETGEYLNVFENRFGCDSVVILNLTVHPVHITNIEEIICESERVTIGNSVYTETGIYENYFVNQFGCDSVVVLNLTVNPVSHTFLSETICEGESVIIGNSVYTTTGNYIDYFKNQFGCDSIVELDLQVNPVYDTTIYVEICQGLDYQIGDFLFEETGVYPVTLTNRFGCDSVVVLDLVILPVLDSTIVTSICKGEVLEAGNTEFDETGIYTEIVQNAYGCDSVITVNLTVLPVSDTLLEVEICEGDSVMIGSSVYKTSGVYTNLFTNRFGCDSLVTLNLLVHPVYNILLTESICDGESFTVGGVSYYETGIYDNNLLTQFGCDSLVTLDLTVNPVNDTSLSVVLCKGDTYSLGEREIYWPGNFTAVLTNQFGCDSVVTLDLSFKPLIYKNLNYKICEGDSLVVGNSVYKNTGNYKDVLVSRFGCDSIITTNLTVLPSSDTTIYVTICEGDSYSINNTEYNTEGTFYHTLENQWGCDSLIVLYLEVNPSDEVHLSETICEGETVMFNGESYNQSGIYTFIFENRFGCDSVVIFELNVNPVKETLLEVEICEGSEYELAGTHYEETGIYKKVFISDTGCDSTVILDLKVLPPNETIIDESICQGESIMFAGEELFETGVYTQYLTNKSGCDSVVVLNLEVNQTNETIIEETICEGQSVLFGNENISLTGIYTNTYVNHSGCDSVVVLNLTVNPASDTALYYDIHWGDSIVIGNSVYKTTGVYTEYLTNQIGCDSVVVLDLNVNEDVQVGIGDLSDLDGSVRLYPNPAKESVSLEIQGITGSFQINIVSMDGKIQYVNLIRNENHTYTKTIKLHNFSNGIYSVIIESDVGIVTRKLIVR